ncbi:MAG TPA: carboxymuconolactone decarboxylase family protein [Acidimicrobiales bacterium]|nr:carboxymuconolactone decarboxylase family protein [Acidimicrobiales bacterium]
MSRLRQVARSDSSDPVVHGMYDLVFGKDVDPMSPDAPRTDTGSRGDWWTTFALVPDVLEHAVAGFVLYRSPERRLDPVLRELALARIGWAVGSAFVYSQHVQALRGLGAPDGQVVDLPAWSVSGAYGPTERAVLAYADALATQGGRVSDGCFGALQAVLGDEEILELTYVGALYVQHAVMSRALRLEWDDRPDPVTTVDPPEGFDASRFATTGADSSARQQLARLRGRR